MAFTGGKFKKGAKICSSNLRLDVSLQAPPSSWLGEVQNVYLYLFLWAYVNTMSSFHCFYVQGSTWELARTKMTVVSIVSGEMSELPAQQWCSIYVFYAPSCENYHKRA